MSVQKNSTVNIVRNGIILAIALLVIAAGTIYVMDRWIMPAYTNYNEGITVPDITKLPLEQAQEKLERYGLRHEVLDRRAHAAFPADYIIDQAPPVGQIVKPDRKVYLTVNTTENPSVTVPDLVNMSLRNARIQLENYGLAVGTISYESSRFRSTVLRQSIPAGETVDQGTVVDLAISDGLGDQMVTVPELEGLLLSDAQQAIREAGLRIGEIRFQPTRNITPNTVLSFSPDSRELREGESLDLVISERYDAREVNEAGAVMDEAEELPDPGQSTTDTDNEPENNIQNSLEP